MTPANVNALLAEHGYDGEVDVLSIDIDSYDYWILEALTVTSPRILVLEYNALFGPDRRVTIPLDQPLDATPKGYNGASLAALTTLAPRKGYRLVTCENAGVNAFFLRHDVAPDVPAVTPARGVQAAAQPRRHRRRGDRDRHLRRGRKARPAAGGGVSRALSGARPCRALFARAVVFELRSFCLPVLVLDPAHPLGGGAGEGREQRPDRSAPTPAPVPAPAPGAPRERFERRRRTERWRARPSAPGRTNMRTNGALRAGVRGRGPRASAARSSACSSSERAACSSAFGPSSR